MHEFESAVDAAARYKEHSMKTKHVNINISMQPPRAAQCSAANPEALDPPPPHNEKIMMHVTLDKAGIDAVADIIAALKVRNDELSAQLTHVQLVSTEQVHRIRDLEQQLLTAHAR